MFIAGTSATLSRLIEDQLVATGGLDGYQVQIFSTRHFIGDISSRIALFLYRVEVDEARRNIELPRLAADNPRRHALAAGEHCPNSGGWFFAHGRSLRQQPHIQTLGATNVRSGPGLQYDVIGELVYLEVRYIVGRAETAEWWLIQFNNGQLGWVSNDIVLVQGYTPIVPIVEAPPLNGSTPTPPALWNPTPFPSCTVTPVPSNTPTAAAETAQVVAEPTATPTSPPTEIPPTEVLPTATPISQPTVVAVNPTAPTVTAVPTAAPEQGGGSSVIFIGLAAVVAVGLGFFFLRRR